MRRKLFIRCNPTRQCPTTQTWQLDPCSANETCSSTWILVWVYRYIPTQECWSEFICSMFFAGRSGFGWTIATASMAERYSWGRVKLKLKLNSKKPIPSASCCEVETIMFISCNHVNCRAWLGFTPVRCPRTFSNKRPADNGRLQGGKEGWCKLGWILNIRVQGHYTPCGSSV